MKETLTVDEALLLHAAALARYGGRDGMRDRGLLESALAQPLASFQGQDLHPTLWDKAAALGRSLIANHPFVDGNKRVGFVAMDVVLQRHGYRLECSPDEGEQITLGVAAGAVKREELAAWLQSHCVREC